MASEKRKDGTSLLNSRDDRSSKRRRLDTSPNRRPWPPSERHTKSSGLGPENFKLPAFSAFANEQPAFPRGGASILTPLEKKEIRARAYKDVLIEQKQKKTGDLFDPRHSDESFSDSQDDTTTKVKDGVTKSRFKKSWTGPRLQQDDADVAPRIEGLSYKRITAGSLILGRIAKVNARDLAISLPNNLTGYVPLTAISAQFTAKIESLLGKEVETVLGTEESTNEENDLHLDHYFHSGQWVRVAVTSTGDDAVHGTARTKRRIELSLEPELTNDGLAWKDLATNCTLQASVISVEDHGVVVDIGLHHVKVNGFIPSQELPHELGSSQVKPGMVFLCLVTGLPSTGRVVTLSAKTGRVETKSILHALGTAPSIKSFLPGTLVEIVLSSVAGTGLAGKVMGMLDVTSDVVQSGARSSSASLEDLYKPGSKIIGRLICTFPLSDLKKVGFSILRHVIDAGGNASDSDQQGADQHTLHISSIIEKAKVVKVDPGLGLYFKLGLDSLEGFAHVSRISDSKIDALSANSGPYKLGTEHKARILEYNTMDSLFLLSLQETVIKQPFLRLEDVRVGKVVKGKVEKPITDENGLKGIIISLSERVTGFVPRIHLSDAQLQHPEKKFREGSIVSARVLSTDTVKRQVRLTLKKSLINSDLEPWTEYSAITTGASSLGTLVKVQSNGAVVQFYASVRGFLPVAEMSEAYIKDATQHFREGQVLNVSCLHVDAENSKLTLSCRDPTLAPSQQVLQDMIPGTIVDGTIFQKSEDDLLLRLASSDIPALLEVDHVSDGSLRKRHAALHKMRVGQQLSGLLILEVQVKRRLVRLCNRASLLKASKDGSLLHGVQDVREGKKVTGFVSNITPNGIFVSFAAGLTGLLSRNQISNELLPLPDFNFTRLQSITTTISSIDYKGSQPRFWLSQRDDFVRTSKLNGADSQTEALADPVDGCTKSIDQFNVGTVTKARVTSVKDTQVNVELATKVQGRIDVSEMFDKWEDMTDRKKPLRAFSPKLVLPVRILGAHDARNHRFLPISHRNGKTPVFELSAKPSTVKNHDAETLTLEKVSVGSTWLTFVNNVGEDFLWVNISPNVRGRIRAIDVSDDLSLLADLEKNFPIGSALKAQVVSVDNNKNYLDLTAKASGASNQLTLEELSRGMILPGRVTKTSERQVLIQLSHNIVGAVSLIDLADDYAKADPTILRKNEIVRVCVLDNDLPNKRIFLSLRPSKVLSSSLPVEDREITFIGQLHVNDVVRGFICNVADKGVFVTLGHSVTAFVRVSNLSDSYIKEWRDEFHRNQLVKGRIISLDADCGHVQMSLKDSVLKPDYVAPITLADLEVGQFVTGKVAKVEDFGVFIVVDSSANVRGLCHRSEIAEQRVEDARELFSEGDVVKAKVLRLDRETQKISFGLKASYFSNDLDADKEQEVGSDDEENVSLGGVDLGKDSTDDDSSTYESGDEDKQPGADDEMSEDSEGVPRAREDDDTSSAFASGGNGSQIENITKSSLLAGLQVGGFDWQGLSAQSTSKPTSNPSSDTEQALPKHKKKRKPAIQTDLTDDLDARGPQTTDDYERLLLSQPDSSLLWLQYMAFHLSLGEIDTARYIAQRALKTISPIGGGHSESEKLNVWIALLNLENAYGDDETIETTFRSACQVNDPQKIHERLASIYIQSSKHEKADQLFQTMLKRFGAADPKIWINHATFLFDTLDNPERGRLLLSRALQTLPSASHIDITSKFAALEFRSASGLAERGRTIFEGLLDSFPKRVDLWNVLLDLETRYGGEGGDKKGQVRKLFERIFDGSGANGRQMKNKQARFFFKRWLEFEEREGDERSAERVKKRAEEWVASKKKDSHHA